MTHLPIFSLSVPPKWYSKATWSYNCTSEILNFHPLSRKYYLLTFMLKLIAKIFGSKSEKDIKRMTPLVEQTKKEGENLVSISNDELRNKSLEVQHYINSKLKLIDEQIASFHQRIADHPK